MSAVPLPAVAMGEGSGPPAILLHGFAGAAESWAGIQPRLAESGPTIAFDLPGHAGAKDYPGFGPPKIAARAVIAEMDRRGVAAAHLAGHSMGGAVAALVGLFAPERVASLVLLAPGGFGRKIGLAALRPYALAEDAASFASAVAAMGAPGWQPDAASLERHREVRARQSPAAIHRMFELLFGSGEQGVLPLPALAEKPFPVRLVWGEADPVTPFAAALSAPESFALERLPATGHMLIDEAPDAVAAAISAARASLPLPRPSA